MLESHPPTAVIVDGGFLSHALELICDMNESVHYFVIVVGEADKTVLAQASDQVKIVLWTDIEEQGKEAAPITVPAPGNRRLFVQVLHRTHPLRFSPGRCVHSVFLPRRR